MTSNPQDPIREVPVTEIIPHGYSSACSLSPPTTGTELDPGTVAWANPELRASNDHYNGPSELVAPSLS